MIPSCLSWRGRRSMHRSLILERAVLQRTSGDVLLWGLAWKFFVDRHHATPALSAIFGTIRARSPPKNPTIFRKCCGIATSLKRFGGIVHFRHAANGQARFHSISDPRLHFLRLLDFKRLQDFDDERLGLSKRYGVSARFAFPGCVSGYGCRRRAVAGVRGAGAGGAGCLHDIRRRRHRDLQRQSIRRDCHPRPRSPRSTSTT